MSNIISDRIFKDTSEKKILNKFDILYVLFIVFLSFFLIFFGIFFVKKTGNRAIVKYNNKEIMAIGLNKNQIITLKKKQYPLLLDDMVIEVRDKKIAVIKEKSPYNYCSIAGFTNESTRPIICQPNKVVILIEDVENINKKDIDAEVH